MNVVERCSGLPLTPELRAMVRTAFERSFQRIEHQVAELRVRLVAVPEGVECHVVLRPRGGAVIVSAATRPAVLDAVLASGHDLARELQRRLLSQSRRSRRRRAA
jgi:hypothetical protein